MWEGKVENLKTMRRIVYRARTHTHTAQLHCVRSLSGITIRSSRRCDLPRCNNITRSLVYFLADTKLLPRNYLKRNFAIPQKIVSATRDFYALFLSLWRIDGNNSLFFFCTSIYIVPFDQESVRGVQDRPKCC